MQPTGTESKVRRLRYSGSSCQLLLLRFYCYTFSLHKNACQNFLRFYMLFGLLVVMRLYGLAAKKLEFQDRLDILLEMILSCLIE